MSDLTKRLHELANIHKDDMFVAILVDQSVARIEELEGALLNFIQHAVDSGWDGPMIERARELLK